MSFQQMCPPMNQSEFLSKDMHFLWYIFCVHYAFSNGMFPTRHHYFQFVGSEVIFVGTLKSGKTS